MRRVVVLGGTGQFGRTAVEHLERLGIAAQTAARTPPADLPIDANHPASIRSALRPGDLVIDTAGPFDTRNTGLVEAAIDVGFDVIDLNDELGYAERLVALQQPIAQAGIRVLSSASTVSAVAAAVLRHSGIEQPVGVTAFLAPASRHAAPGATRSLLRTLGQPIRVLRAGRLQTAVGWSEARRFAMPPPVGPLCGRLFESADALWLPRRWPTLRDVAMYVDANAPGGNATLRLAARIALLRRLLERHVRRGTWLARRIGSAAGGVGYEIDDDDGRAHRYALLAPTNCFLAAVAPAVLAAKAICEDRFPHHGLVPPECHVEPAELWLWLQSQGITVTPID